jgi:hypothetical protein
MSSLVCTSPGYQWGSIPCGICRGQAGLSERTAEAVRNLCAIGHKDRGTAALTIQAGGNLLDAGSYSQGNGSTQVNGNLSTSLFHVTGGSVRTGSGGVLDIGTGGFTQAGSTVNIIDAGGKMTSAGFVAQGGGTAIVNGVLSAVLFHFTGDSVLVGSGGT